MTAVAAVIDYLYAGIRALPACAAPVQVTDGWPGTSQAQQLVCVGGGPEDDEQSTKRDFILLGNGPSTREEEFEVYVYIRCWTGGTVQKTCRDQAVTIFSAIETFIRSDMNLGGSISRHYPAQINTYDLRQTVAANAQKGRVAEIRFTVKVRNRY